MFIDTHCHISDEYYDDIDTVILENEQAGIEKIIVCGCDKEEIKTTINYINKYSNLFATIGYHPAEASKITDSDISNLEKLICSNKKIVGIGEIGLDYHYGKEAILIQQEVFRKQLSLAEKLHLPVVIHSRDATEDTINCLKKYNVTGVVHCFSGSVETAKQYVSMGYKIGIGGVLTFKNSKLYEVVQAVGIKNIVLETDAPYLAPTPFRGKQNSSKYIPYIAAAVADVLNISVEEVAKITTLNACELFDLKVDL